MYDEGDRRGAVQIWKWSATPHEAKVEITSKK
jgi:hypothetical protein